MCEILKALFNLYIQSDDTTQEKEKNKSLVSILYKLLLFQCEKETDLQRYTLPCTTNNYMILSLSYHYHLYFSNIANLLTVIPYNCYSAIIPPCKEKRKHVYQDVDMSAISVLLQFLDRRLNCKEDMIGNLSPIVTAFIRLIRAERLIRKYTRLKVN